MKEWSLIILEQFKDILDYDKYPWIKNFVIEFVKHNRSKYNLVPYVTIKRYLNISLNIISKIKNLDRIEWINDPKFEYNVFSIKLFLTDEKGDVDTALIKKYANKINCKTKKNFIFQFYSLIDKISFTPELDDVSYNLRIIGRFKYIDEK